MARLTPRKVGDLDQLMGERVRTRRMILKMTQEDLASALGVTFQQLQKYEKGTNRISAVRLIEIAAALQTNPMTILTGADGNDGNKDTVSTPFSKFLATRGGVELVGAMVEIKSPAVRQAITNLAMSLRGR